MIHNLNKDVKRGIMDKDIAIKEIELHAQDLDHDLLRKIGDGTKIS